MEGSSAVHWVRAGDGAHGGIQGGGREARIEWRSYSSVLTSWLKVVTAWMMRLPTSRPVTLVSSGVALPAAMAEYTARTSATK
eukprot:38236-Prorocentrum_minimum.AAC.1